jgi:hypothetical protein
MHLAAKMPLVGKWRKYVNVRERISKNTIVITTRMPAFLTVLAERKLQKAGIQKIDL